MPTVAETLKASGLTDEQIAGLDARIIAGFDTVLTTAEQARQSAAQLKEQAETAQRAQAQQYDTKIAPALDQWGNEKTMLEAELQFYRTQNEQGRANGFIPKEAPGYNRNANPNPNPNPNPNGYVANTNVVPGSPSFMTKEEGLRAVANATWAVSEYQRLHGAPIPDDIETLSAEAEGRHMKFRDHVAQKYNFEAKRAEIVATRQNAEIEKQVNERFQKKERELVERLGNNPNVRMGAPSEFTNLRKGVDSKTVKDPLSMSKQERHQYTQSLINQDIAQNASSTVN
jgi:hypothetical protein